MRSDDGVALRARGLRKRYAGGVEALRGLDLEVRRGEMVGLVGPSGAGKTTLLRLVNGSLRPTAGELRVLGKEIAHLRGASQRTLRHRVATVPQTHGLVPSLTAAQNVLLGTLGGRSIPGSLRILAYLDVSDQAAAFASLAAVGLGERMYARTNNLSGGQRQRVAVARAIVQEPEMLAADEPVASVDAETAGMIMEVLRDLNRRGCTVLVSLHQPEVARQYCPRLVMLDAGRITYDGPSEGMPASAARTG